MAQTTSPPGETGVEGAVLDARVRALVARGEGTRLEGYREKIFADRYALKGSEGKPLEEYPEQMWLRVARAIAQVEPEDRRDHWSERFYELLSGFRFVPGGRILSGAGSGTDVTYYNCFVIEQPEDSVGGIFENIARAAQIMRRSGGVGVNLSSLRPRGAYIKTVNGTASGPCSWGILYSDMTGKVIIQGGSRRGALMLMLDDDHPDIEEFVEYKRKNPGHIDHANLSVAVSDRFMEAVRNDEPWELTWKGEVWRTIRARDLWNKIAESAHAYAEPGVVWMDRYNKLSNTHYFENIRCVNPCGEQGLPSWGVCNLGALNLVSFVRGEGDDAEFDYDALAVASADAIRFLDNVIDATNYPFEENREAQQNGARRTGLGTMGIADVLIKLGLRYGAPEAEPTIERIYRTIRDASYEASAELAAEKGPFPRFEREPFLAGAFIRELPEGVRGKIDEHGIRNAVLLTQAPTGTTSSLAGVNSGIEPVFAFVTKRTDRLGEHVLYHPLAQEWKDAHPETPLPPYFVASGDLSPEEHVRVQAVVQRYTDSSISKTLNGPATDTVEDVERLYRLAYDSGCKGVTYYRQGSRDAVLEAVTETTAKVQDAAAEAKAAPEDQPEAVKSADAPADGVASPEPIAAERPAAVAPQVAPQGEPSRAVAQPYGAEIRSRPQLVGGYTRQVRAPEGKINITLNSDDAGLFEVFINLGKAGSDIAAMAEALGRLISLNLQMPSPMSAAERTSEMADQLRGIGGSRTVGFGPQQVKSLPDAVSQALLRHLESLRAEQRHAERPAPGAVAPTPADGAAPGPAPTVEAVTGGNGHPANGHGNGNGVAVAVVPASRTIEQLLEETVKLTGNLCPSCGCNSLVHQEGCRKCYTCGHSEC